MRAAFALAALLALSACRNNDQADNTQNVDENLSAEDIVSNDVTAIDAVTGDAANMAADVNYTDENLGEASDATAKPSTRPSAAKPSAKPKAEAPATNTAAATSNAQ